MGKMFTISLFIEMSFYLKSESSAFNEHTQQKKRMEKWLRTNNINQSIRRRVDKYYQLLWQTTVGLKQKEIINDLPRSIRKRVRSNIFKSLIANCPIFPKDDPGQVQSIISRLQIQLIPKEEFIVHRRE
jgi:hypothetical protein